MQADRSQNGAAAESHYLPANGAPRVREDVYCVGDVQRLAAALTSERGVRGLPSLFVTIGDAGMIIAQSDAVSKMLVLYQDAGHSYYAVDKVEVEQDSERMFHFDFDGSFSEVPERFWIRPGRAWVLVQAFLETGHLTEADGLVQEY